MTLILRENYLARKICLLIENNVNILWLRGPSTKIKVSLYFILNEWDTCKPLIYKKLLTLTCFLFIITSATFYYLTECKRDGPRASGIWLADEVNTIESSDNLSFRMSQRSLSIVALQVFCFSVCLYFNSLWHNGEVMVRSWEW